MTRLAFAPLLPWPFVAALATLALLAVALAAWRRLPGWWLRGLAAVALLGALAGPRIETEALDPLTDIVVAVIDESSSQTLGDRTAQTEAALARIEAEVARRPNTELRVARVTDPAPGSPDEDAGTRLMGALAEALAGEPPGRVAAIVLVTDGRVHDLPAAPALPAPTHVLLTGAEADWDRRLVVMDAPAFGILDEELTLRVRVEDQGAAPEGTATVPLTIAIDGGEPLPFDVPIGQDMDLPLVLPHGGMNVLEFATPAVDGELTERNNRAVVQINGVRDRLRVLLVSGEPHAGERTWRNLLKSDPAVDLVHFTILRPPEKQDGVPTEELSLIAFPTTELFIDKIDEFDLIIFDRYSQQGILPPDYLQNIVRYVEAGGALLVASGPEFAGAESVWRSPLGAVIPGQPTARVQTEGYVPRVSPLGTRHPVTADLESLAPRPAAQDGTPGWGRWLRLVEVIPTATAEVVMEGPQANPLLLLDRVGQGRVALLATDHAWLWDRGYEGGGPQAELLRRLAHWLMQEPELEEESLAALPAGQGLRVIRRSMAEDVPEVRMTAPDGTETVVPVEETGPGLFEALVSTGQTGLHRLSSGDLSAVIVTGPAAPREFEETIATGDLLAPVIEPTAGGVLRIEDGLPSLRDVREGRPAHGRGWIGMVPREAAVVTDIDVTPALPPWAWLLLAAGLTLAAWLREGRGGGRVTSASAP